MTTLQIQTLEFTMDDSDIPEASCLLREYEQHEDLWQQF